MKLLMWFWGIGGQQTDKNIQHVFSALLQFLNTFQNVWGQQKTSRQYFAGKQISCRNNKFSILDWMLVSIVILPS